MPALKYNLNKSSFIRGLTASVIFIAGSLYETYPLIFHLTNFITGKGDELFITWVLNWNIHSFTGNILNIFNANIFYPYQNTLAYSDTHFISSILAFIPEKLSGEPIMAFNFILILTLILSGLSIYFLAYKLTKSFLPSIVSGLLVLFSYPFINETPHLQVIAIYFVPLSILFFLKFIEEKKTRFLAVTSI